MSCSEQSAFHGQATDRAWFFSELLFQSVAAKKNNLQKLLNFHNFLNLLIFQNEFLLKNEIATMQKDANRVDLEKCCQTHIFLQHFVLIQPRTSPPKICKI